jgi:hypothetical protein
MAIGTYSELQTAVASWLVRRDLTARIPEFITLAESRLNRVLRTRRGEVTQTTTAPSGARQISLPAAYSEALNVWLVYPGSSERTELRFVDPARLTVSTISGCPAAWTIDGSNLAFERPCDQDYEIAIRALEKFALSDAAPTNALLTDYPDAYLYATLAEAGPALRDADTAAAYEGKLSRAIAEINAKDARSRSQQKLSTEVGQMQRAGSGAAIRSIGTADGGRPDPGRPGNCRRPWRACCKATRPRSEPCSSRASPRRCGRIRRPPRWRPRRRPPPIRIAAAWSRTSTAWR